jgi:hypothetical protein
VNTKVVVVCTRHPGPKKQRVRYERCMFFGSEPGSRVKEQGVITTMFISMYTLWMLGVGLDNSMDPGLLRPQDDSTKKVRKGGRGWQRIYIQLYMQLLPARHLCPPVSSSSMYPIHQPRNPHCIHNMACIGCIVGV